MKKRPPGRQVSYRRPPGDSYSNLAKRPDVAQEIGNLIAAFSVLERQIPALFKFITQASDDDAERIMGSMTCGLRIDLMNRLLSRRNKTHADSEYGIAAALCEKLGEANGIRNRYAHSIYSIRGRGILVSEYVSDAKRPSTLKRVTVAKIAQDRNRIESLIWFLSGFLHRNERPPKRFLRSRRPIAP